MVRQFTARRLEENAATRPKKKKMPATACPRGPIMSRAAYAAAPIKAMAAQRETRHVHGVGGWEGSAGGIVGAGSVLVVICVWESHAIMRECGTEEKEERSQRRDQIWGN